VSTEAALPYESALREGALPRAKEVVKRVLSESALPLGTVIRVATREPVIALTFDDGPHPEDTPPLLEVLERHGARGTFFMVGQSARRYPELVKRVAEAGHAIGNHTWDHLSMPLLSGRYRRRQIEWCDEALAPYGAKLFRPPYGEQSLGSRLDALRARHQVIAWDVIAEDWRDDPADVLLARIYRRLRRGSIVLLHDTLHTTVDERYRDRAPMREAVERLLIELGDRFRFVTVPELLRLGRPFRWHWYQRARLDWLKRVR
jgi:peptidoglycan/xylan/chitin deacetylase (PgdA/CDA1 family)